MKTINKLILVVLAGIILIFVGGGTPASAAPSSYETSWSSAMNKASYWSDFFGMTCTKYENHNGHIPAQYDAAVIKDGSAVVKVYPDLTNTGAFTATGAINPANGKTYPAPHSWVMKCDAPPPTTTVPPTTVPETTVPPTTVPETTVPPTTTPETTVPETTVPETTVPPTTVPETTTPATTVPETTVPETTTSSVPPTVPQNRPTTTFPPLPDVCYVNDSTETIERGKFTFMDGNDPRAVGTHSISGIPCGLTPVTVPPPVVHQGPQTLPSTGFASDVLPWVAAGILMIGLSLWGIGRGKQSY